MADMPTMNADRLRELDRTIAAVVCGDIEVSAKTLDTMKRERADLLAHFARATLCPTCGHRVTHALTAAVTA